MKKNLSLKSIFGFLIIFSLLSSCVHEKEFIYFQNQKKDSTVVLADSIKNYIPTLRTDDLLSITVSAVDPELAKPFNLFMQKDGGSSTIHGYLIDANGMIDFPVLGSLKLVGLNRMEATSLIKERLKAYIKDPIVNLRIMNYKVTVLGEVLHPGVFNIPNERITIPEAIGLAGDLTLGGKRNNIMVIRDVDGKKTETRIDLTSRDVFTSPVYYLTQNDVVYVEPTLSKIKTTQPTRQNASLALTGVLLIINVINLITRL